MIAYDRLALVGHCGNEVIESANREKNLRLTIQSVMGRFCRNKKCRKRKTCTSLQMIFGWE